MSPPSFRAPGDIVNEVYLEKIQSVIQLCSDVGDDPSALMEQAKRELQKMVTEMMAEDDALLERKRSEVAPIRTRYESLHHELHPEKTCPQYTSTLPVLQALRTYVEEYKKLKEEHGKLIECEPDIRREERQLCNELNERSLQVENANFNSKQLVTQISLLSEHIAELREEKTQRINHLSDVLRTLHEYEEVYGWKRPTAETRVARLLDLGLIQVEQYTLTKEAVELVDKEFAEISEEVQKAEACFEESHKQLKILMRKHQSLVPNDRALAATNIKHCRMSKLPDLIAEVDRYTEHAMEKLTNDIVKARERIHVILNKLSVSDLSNNSKYAILNTNEFTEDIYFMHEELVQELEAQYEVNRSMYEQIEVWNGFFLEYQEFEKNASDPQRFHRRGYSALTEDRTRKKLEANLRESELRLERCAEEFRAKNNGRTFLLNESAKEISEYIAQRKEDYAKSKERDREAAKGGQGTIVGRTPLKSKQLVHATPGAAPKRLEANAHLRTPAPSTAATRRVGIPHLPTGKTPLHNSTMKPQSKQQLQTTKRNNLDSTSSSIITPIKQRRMLDAIENTSTNSLGIGNVTAGLKGSMTTTPSTKRTIPTPLRTRK